MDAAVTDSLLFRGVKPETAALAASACTEVFRKGREIPAGSLGLVLSGTVRAEGAVQEKSPILNTFRPGDWFGMASLFGASCGDTRLRAASDCRLLLLDQATLEALIRSDGTFACNYAAFLTEKIRFLNRKIAAFTAGTAEKTLLRYLLSLPAVGNTVTVPMSYTRLAESLCIARSSLYRALDALEARGLMARRDDAITLTDREELLTFYGGTSL